MKGYHPNMVVEAHNGSFKLKEYAFVDPDFMVARLCALSKEHEEIRTSLTASEKEAKRHKKDADDFAKSATFWGQRSADVAQDLARVNGLLDELESLSGTEHDWESYGLKTKNILSRRRDGDTCPDFRAREGE